MYVHCTLVLNVKLTILWHISNEIKNTLAYKHKIAQLVNIRNNLYTASNIQRWLVKDNWQYNRSAKPKETFETGGQDKIMEDRISSAFAAAKEQRGEGTTKIEISPTRQLNAT